MEGLGAGVGGICDGRLLPVSIVGACVIISSSQRICSVHAPLSPFRPVSSIVFIALGVPVTKRVSPFVVPSVHKMVLPATMPAEASFAASAVLKNVNCPQVVASTDITCAGMSRLNITVVPSGTTPASKELQVAGRWTNPVAASTGDRVGCGLIFVGDSLGTTEGSRDGF